MSALTFTLKYQPAQRVDLSPLVSQKLQDLSLSEIASLELQNGNRRIRVDELFTINGTDSQNIVIANSFYKLDFIGKELENGHITVLGDAGAYLGFAMKSGSITVKGNTGIYTACELKNGFIEVEGDAGDFIGGALPGNKIGMKGGTVLIKGNAGSRVGDHMRRGQILIEGNVGDYCGSRMSAGTIAVMGTSGRYIGYAMRRGTLLLWNPPQLSATFNDCGSHTLSFLSLLFNSFTPLNSRFAHNEVRFDRVQRYGGDLAETGRGEILVKL
jgi:formylmethanofuran dehydrogenase subunit C